MPDRLARSASDSVLRINVREACSDCGSPGIGLVGIAEIQSRIRKGYLPGLWALGTIGVAACVLVFVWFPIHDVIVDWYGFSDPGIKDALMFLGTILLTWLVVLVISKFPMRIMMCAQCKRIKRIGLGKGLPLSWQEAIEPDWKCTRCGYLLHGITEEPRCPECGTLFPAEWLKFTSKGDPDIAVEYEVVP